MPGRDPGLSDSINNRLCPTCDGTGETLQRWDTDLGGKMLRCPTCLGKGEVPKDYPLLRRGRADRRTAIEPNRGVHRPAPRSAGKPRQDNVERHSKTPRTRPASRSAAEPRQIEQGQTTYTNTESRGGGSGVTTTVPESESRGGRGCGLVVVVVLGALIVGMAVATFYEDILEFIDQFNQPPTITVQILVTATPPPPPPVPATHTPVPTVMPTSTALPTSTPKPPPTVTATRTPRPIPTALPAAPSMEFVIEVVSATALSNGQVDFVLEVKNEGDWAIDEVSQVEMSVDDGAPELVNIIGALAPGESQTFAFTRALTPGDRKLKFSVGDTHTMVSVNVEAVDITATPVPTPVKTGRLVRIITATPITTSAAEPTATVTPTILTLVYPTPTNTATLTPIPTNTPAPGNTPTPSRTPLPIYTAVPINTPTPRMTPLPTNTAVPTNTPIPTMTPLPTYTAVPTNTPESESLVGRFFKSTKDLTETNDSSQPDIDVGVLEILVHNLINQERTKRDLEALYWDEEISVIARNHSVDMGAENYFSHVNQSGQDPTDRGASAGYECIKDYGSYYTFGLAENIHQGWLYSSITTINGVDFYNWLSQDDIASRAVNGWMGSQGHRENILKDTYDRTGIGIGITSEGKVFITQNFC